MTATSGTGIDRRRLYRSGWLVAVFAISSYLLVAFSEQGSAGAGLQIVPADPLPFQRHTSAGIDLSGFSSLQALEWLEQTDVSGVALVLLPIDGDIVGAFNNPESYVAARIAVDQLIAEADGATLAVCLSRPLAAIDESVLAEAAVAALVESYTDRITYIGACTPNATPSWQASVLRLLGQDPPVGATERRLAPVSVGASLRLQEVMTIDDVTPEYLDSVTGSTYSALRISGGASIDQETREIMTEILHDRAHVATILVVPHLDSNPAGFVASLTLDTTVYQELSEGFNNARSNRIEWHGEWTATDVGPVSYQRTLDTGSWLTAGFVGTEIWAIGIVSPDGGRLGVWINAGEGQQTGSPDHVVSLERAQARDAAVLLVDGLPAARHTITIVAADGDVALSGLFVTGRPEAGWHGVLGSIGMLLVAVGGLAVVLTAAVDDLRHRIGLDRADDDDSEHPRVFRRDL